MAIELPIDEIDFDRENPRIQNALEKYEAGQIGEKQIFFALQSVDPDGDSSSSGGYSKLRTSIKATGEIKFPIQVTKQDNGKYLCIDGNTRLMIYKEFRDNNFQGEWDNIPANIIDDKEDVDQVRIIAHIVGARDWGPFDKAKYLYKLYQEKNLSFTEIALYDICGGNKSEIEQLIRSYEDMVEHYKNRTTEDDFYTDRFSAFVELQNKNVKKSILDAGRTLDDFGDWIIESKIEKVADVRQLPQVLKDTEAREIFINGGVDSIGAAIDLIKAKKHNERARSKKDGPDLESLIEDLYNKMQSLPRSEMQKMQDRVNNSRNSSLLVSLRELQLEINSLINELDSNE